MTVLYRHFDLNNRLVYVGIAADEPSRRRQHKRTSSWFHLVAKSRVEFLPSREAALAAEKVAIRTERPAFNKALNGGRALFVHEYLDSKILNMKLMRRSHTDNGRQYRRYKRSSAYLTRTSYRQWLLFEHLVSVVSRYLRRIKAKGMEIVPGCSELVALQVFALLNYKITSTFYSRSILVCGQKRNVFDRNRVAQSVMSSDEHGMFLKLYKDGVLP